MKIAVDAMGGDHAPDVVVQGAIEAATQLGIEIILVGHEKAIAEVLPSSGFPVGRISVHHCTEVVGMDEAPLKAVRHKKDSSIRVVFDLVKGGEVDAVVSAGNSGAILAAGVITLGRMEAADRPAIASILPGEKGPVVLIDVGANVDCRPAHLFQFGVMAQAFATSCLGMDNPKIGLLSIGEEGSKGNEQVRHAHELFERSLLNFAGNVEGHDIVSGDVQIIVCDGFVGNVALKLSEGLAATIARALKRELAGSLSGRVAAHFGRRSFERLRRRLDYEEHGGAPLLGINGVGIVCHGGSSARAIRNAIGLAASYVSTGVLEKMAVQLNTYKAKRAVGQE